MRDKADGAGSPRTRAHGMLRRPFMQREHQRASEPMLAVWREHGEAAELVSVSILAVREHAADSADRGQGGDEAEEKVGRGVVRPVKSQTDVRLGKKNPESLVLVLVLVWGGERVPSGSRVGARRVHTIEKGSALASGVLLRSKGGRGGRGGTRAYSSTSVSRGKPCSWVKTAIRTSKHCCFSASRPGAPKSGILMISCAGAEPDMAHGGMRASCTKGAWVEGGRTGEGRCEMQGTVGSMQYNEGDTKRVRTFTLRCSGTHRAPHRDWPRILPSL